MSLSDSSRQKKRGGAQTATTSSTTAAVTEPQRIVADQVTSDRRAEILEYLKLFGYKPDRSILQVHIAGFFNKNRASPKAVEKREASARRYGGRTFVVVGRTHDPSIMDAVIKPKNNRREATSPGYIGYLWKNKDPHNRAPHVLVPLDFTPSHVAYPEEWKNMFATKGFMLALHVPASFAKDKNKLLRALYRSGKKADVRKQWNFIEEVKSSGYYQLARESEAEDPLQILKIRLAKGEIDQQEYEKLRQTLTS